MSEAETESSNTESTAEAETESDTEAETETTSPEDVDADVDVDDKSIEGILEIRQSLVSTTDDIVGRPLDGITEITATEEGWRGVVEVIERASIPDTQDILGRYEMDLTEDGVVEGYRRIDRYRRDDTSDKE